MVPPNYRFHFGGIHGNFDYMALTELHLHLEGTVDRDTLLLLDPDLSRAEVDYVWGFTNFQGFIDCFKVIARRLNTPQDYALITRRMIESLAAQGIEYAEVTLAAGVILWRELDFDAIWRAIREAQQNSPVEIHWNLDAIRQFGPTHVMEVARLAANYVGDGAISFGIGGDELRGPAREFREAYAFARDAGLRLTAHAGETDGPQSIRDALDVGAERIGHGITAVHDADLMRRLREERVPLEVCITSNVRTGVAANTQTHPARKLFDAGVILTLNSDDPGIFESNLIQERELSGFSPDELKQIDAYAQTSRFNARTALKA